ncbi:M1 family peptidase [Lacihabitans sp. LS3-19]|uniref:M1 family metallopeptidase n=1 Tax=Lacihabitans sp. LS3-19 TaxID=2487335 RepID=UPI0020CF3B92|nr:M1 family metallopeptidase [Lacihabitans sp. LS3-19]MCP9770816.1 M1 family peptidase [Lacihabitans sp. LS3-19]
MKKILFLFFVLIYSLGFSQKKFTLDDTLRGSITPERAWWDLQYYALNVKVEPKNKFISGFNIVKYKVLTPSQTLQIDLQSPMFISRIEQDGENLSFTKKGQNAYFIRLKKAQIAGDIEEIKVYFSGKPLVAKRAPWDGGFSWTKDKNGKDFIATSCQGLGSSVWWPCKDHMYDEVDSMRISVTVPDSLRDISNGRMEKMCISSDGLRTTDWVIKNPINNYGVNVNIGNYVNWGETFDGEKGPLSVDYYVLPQNLDKAKKQFLEVPRMLKAFEYWFGPYPFYEDGYKLVEVPYLGMEHQSSITYGNKFKNGYLGRDLSGTGWGSKWDFIIVHESGHEWFANNITYKDIADMWIHESFTNYSETLFTEFYWGKEAGRDYVIGTRSNIQNDAPIIGIYDVNERGSGDMYYKGGNMIHTIRQVINDDEKFRQILRGLNSNFYHQTVTTAQIENYISEQAGIDFSKVFDQYLRGTKIPKLAKKVSKGLISFRWENVVAGFNMPVKVTIDDKEQFIYPTTDWKKIKGNKISVDRNFYIN